MARFSARVAVPWGSIPVSFLPPRFPAPQPSQGFGGPTVHRPAVSKAGKRGRIVELHGVGPRHSNSGARMVRLFPCDGGVGLGAVGNACLHGPLDPLFIPGRTLGCQSPSILANTVISMALVRCSSGKTPPGPCPAAAHGPPQKQYPLRPRSFPAHPQI